MEYRDEGTSEDFTSGSQRDVDGVDGALEDGTADGDSAPLASGDLAFSEASPSSAATDEAGPVAAPTDGCSFTAPSSDADEQSPSGAVTTALEGVAAQVQAFHTRAANYESIIRQMQSRIEQLQTDQVQALLKPMIQRFAGLHAQASEAAERARERGESAVKDFDFFTAAIEDAFGIVDIESVDVAPGAKFDPKKHHAAQKIPTDDIERDKRVHRVVRQGFTYVDAPRVFLPAQVTVYRYEPSRKNVFHKNTENNPSSDSDEGASVE